ncbi:MAG: tRNA (N6-threonylcarbamoyladenosine(37)-N6)-methyltransferase TrmO [Clostridia bacterium]|nr:tRNA (N6-threonylcarbamoyladenosine(37)-N6)-methyltransferase TrmO [Clostridia bacterium]
MENELIIRPIAHIHADFKEKFGIPRQSGRAPSVQAKIVFTPPYRNAEALREIEGFSHLWLIFDFSKAHKESWSPTVRPPRLGGNKRVGVFASRSPFRPNPLGLSCVKLLRVEHTKDEGDVLIVSGADLLDGTPIFDVKPYLPLSDCQIEATGGYSEEGENHRLNVVFLDDLQGVIPSEKQAGLVECLADDPRPSYQDDATRVYGMRFADFEIKFTVDGDTLTVQDVLKVQE